MDHTRGAVSYTHLDVYKRQSVSDTGVQIGLLACEIIIVIFSFFFVWYSSSAFIKSRANEFGLLSTLGASRRQLSKMIFTESVIIGEIAIGLGLLLGTLLLRMFLSAMSLLLKVDSVSYTHLVGLIKRCDQLKFCDYLLDRIGFILLYLIGICVALSAVWLDVAADVYKRQVVTFEH